MLLLLILTVYLVFKWLKYYKVPENFPPGPPSAPFVGTLPFIKVKICSIFGDLMSWDSNYYKLGKKPELSRLA